MLKELAWYGKNEANYVSPEQRSTQVIAWLQSLPPTLLAVSRSEVEYQTILHTLMEQWDHMPVCYPLVPESEVEL